MPNIVVGELNFPRVTELEAEIVERKGIGHPDSICDGIAEASSAALCRHYAERYGRVLHHNLDKALLVGGRTEAWFGGGEMSQPIVFHLVGRATVEVEGNNVPVEELYLESARGWLKRHLRQLDPDKHVRFEAGLRPGSADLVELFLRSDQAPLANDTSFGVGYAPLTDTEKLVREMERFLNSDQFKARHPEVGEDIKVMGLRRGYEITLTVAAAFIAKYVGSLDDYLDKKAAVREAAIAFARELTDKEVKVHLNLADEEEKGSVYITLTGTSAEAGDDGQVGRGNRVNGLITPFRPMSLEAAAGKNPISHIGKLYNITAIQVAEQVVAQMDEVEEAYCYLLSQIGKPITEPLICNLKLRARSLPPAITDQASRIAAEHLRQLPELWRELMTGHITVF
ncbi:MAG: methionine adenosyltransferase [Acidobacteria bacterium]|nr:methionine adenosyltransferase [Acidobacteriota bacterium]